MHFSRLEVLIFAAFSVGTTFAAPQLGVTIGTTIGRTTVGTFTIPGSTPTTSTKSPTTTFQIPPSDTFGLGDVSRITNIFANISGFAPLPDPTSVVNNGNLNVGDIQGDILIGMRKQVEQFYFFSINNPSSFKSKLRNTIVSQITSTLELLSVSTQPVVSLNIAFSQVGLNKLGKTDNLGDSAFSSGQQADANNLGDPGTTNWVNAFLGKKIHGVFIIASDLTSSISTEVSAIETLFGSDITKQYSLQGNIRPPPFAGHEMFGYLDGISQPAVSGFNLKPVPGQQIIDPGVILTSNDGDTESDSRPDWAKDGSFLVFRQLKQLVPEFNKFLTDNAPTVSGLTKAQSAELLGARMVGRWKSGAPVDLSPLADNPTLAADPNRNNNFDFSHSGSDSDSDQSRCPFSAHIRKSRPRSDQASPLNAIMRAGIPYGPEVTAAETSSSVSGTSTALERGLAFVCYQSQIGQGFKFIQQVWENNPTFPSKSVDAGLDPINGQNHGAAKVVNGLSVADTSKSLTLSKDFVVSRGGEYFFAPSISAIRDVLSA